ncbi:MAG: RluA family pseudouridine synthase [Verrucomicrobiota bacterium]
MALETLFEDGDLLAVNKPAGLLVESSKGNERSLLDLVSEASGRRAIAYHRLDRETSGVVLFGKTARLNKQMGQLFSDKKIRKTYWLLAKGAWSKTVNRVETRIGKSDLGGWSNLKVGGKAALTTFRVLGCDSDVSWVEALPKTGRTHQIRLHCLYAGYPIIGDRIYGEGSGSDFMALHARSLRFVHPLSRESLEIVSQPSEAWSDWLRRFGEGV